MYKKLLLVAGCLCLASGAWAMKEEEIVIEEKPVQKEAKAYISFGGEFIKITPKVIEQLPALQDMLANGEVTREKDSISFNLNDVLGEVEESIGASDEERGQVLRLFVAFVEGSLAVKNIKTSYLKRLLDIAAKLRVAGKNKDQGKRNLLDELSKEYISRQKHLTQKEFEEQEELLKKKVAQKETQEQLEVFLESKKAEEMKPEVVEDLKEYQLSFGGKQIKIKKTGLKLLRVLKEFIDDERLLEGDMYSLPLDAFLQGRRISVDEIQALVDFVDKNPEFKLKETSSKLLISMIFLVDFLGARQLLDELLNELVTRVSHDDFQKFLGGRGLLWEMIDRLPVTVLDKVLKNKLLTGWYEPELLVKMGIHDNNGERFVLDRDKIFKLLELSPGKFVIITNRSALWAWDGIAGSIPHKVRTIISDDDLVHRVERLSGKRLVFLGNSNAVYFWDWQHDTVSPCMTDKLCTFDKLGKQVKGIWSLYELSPGKIGWISVPEEVIVWNEKEGSSEVVGKLKELTIRGHWRPIGPFVVPQGLAVVNVQGERFIFRKKKPSELQESEKKLSEVFELDPILLRRDTSKPFFFIEDIGGAQQVKNGNIVISSGGRIWLWDTQKNTCKMLLGRPDKEPGLPFCIIELPDERLVAGNAAGEVWNVDMRTKGDVPRLLMRLKLEKDEFLRSMVMASDGRLIMATNKGRLFGVPNVYRELTFEQAVLVESLCMFKKMEYGFVERVKGFLTKKSEQAVVFKRHGGDFSYKNLFKNPRLAKLFISLPVSAISLVNRLNGADILNPDEMLQGAITTLLDAFKKELEAENYLAVENVVMNEKMSERLQVIKELIELVNTDKKAFYKKKYAFILKIISLARFNKLFVIIKEKKDKGQDVRKELDEMLVLIDQCKVQELLFEDELESLRARYKEALGK